MRRISDIRCEIYRIATPLPAQPFEEREQPLGFGGRQRRGRLVQDQHPGVARHGAGDGDHLPLGDAQVGHRARARRGRATSRRRSPAPRPASPATARRSPTRAAVSRSSIRLEATSRSGITPSLIDWCTVTTPAANGLGRRGRRIGLAEQLDPPRIGAVHAAQDLDQRRLARAVGAHQDGDLPRGNVEVDPAQDLVRPERLLDPRQAACCG